MDPSSSVFNEIEFKNASELSDPNIVPDLSEEERAKKLEERHCMHLKKIIQAYFNRGVANTLSLNCSAISEASIQKLTTMFQDKGFKVTVNDNSREVVIDSEGNKGMVKSIVMIVNPSS